MIRIRQIALAGTCSLLALLHGSYAEAAFVVTTVDGVLDIEAVGASRDRALEFVTETNSISSEFVRSPSGPGAVGAAHGVLSVADTIDTLTVITNLSGSASSGPMLFPEENPGVFDRSSASGYVRTDVRIFVDERSTYTLDGSAGNGTNTSFFQLSPGLGGSPEVEFVQSSGFFSRSGVLEPGGYALFTLLQFSVAAEVPSFTVIVPEFSVYYTLQITPAPVPLPAGVWLLLSGLGGLGVMRRRVAGQSARD